MRTLLTLLALCPLTLFAKGWQNEISLLAGSGKIIRTDKSQVGFNLGIHTTNMGSFMYCNVGVDIYHLTSEYAGGLGTSYGDRSELIPAVNAGLGFAFSDSSTTFKIGSDLGFQFSTSGFGTYFAATPQMSVTFRLKGATSMGIIAKLNLPVYAKVGYQPSFIGGGLIVRF